jgi:hypothetical protein
MPTYLGLIQSDEAVEKLYVILSKTSIETYFLSWKNDIYFLWSICCVF